MNRRQTIPKHLRYTIQQFQAEYPTDDACLEALKNSRYPDGVTYCEECEQECKLYRVAGRPAYACERGHHFYPLAGTILEHSSTSLRLWFYAMYQMGSTRCGISAKQIQREIGVTYKTAWRMFKQIRTLMSDDDKLEGPTTVEVDETYVGGRTIRRGAVEKPKTTVLGAVERKGGRVIARVAADAKKSTLHGFIKEYVLPGSVVFTDEHPSYDGLEGPYYRHYRIRHNAKIYVTGSERQIHTQTIEGFWSLIKNGLRGVYHNVGKGYLQSYLNEYSFRYNRRDQGNLLFNAILKRVFERACVRPAAKACENHPV